MSKKLKLLPKSEPPQPEVEMVDQSDPIQATKMKHLILCQQYNQMGEQLKELGASIMQLGGKPVLIIEADDGTQAIVQQKD